MKILDRLIIRKCDDAFAGGDWPGVIRLLADNAFLARNPRFLAMKIRAAREAGADGVAEQVARLAAKASMPIGRRYAVVRELVVCERGADAWEVLSADPSVLNDPGFPKQAARVLRYAEDGGLRKQIKTAMREATKGGADIKPEPSGILFPKGEGPLSARGLGSIQIAANPQVPERHIYRLHHEKDAIRARLSNPSEPSVVEYRDVFVDRYGQIWREDGAVIASKGKPIAFGRPPGATVHEGVLAASVTRGIYHWVVDRLPLFAWLYQPHVSMPAILLSDRAPAFEKMSLALAGIDTRAVLDVGDSVFVERLLIARVGFEGLRDWGRIAPVFDRIAENSADLAEAHDVELPSHIYISRRDATRRRLINETEVEIALEKRGYRSVLMGDLPLWHQFAIASNARSIVAPHGAGLAHLMLAAPDASVTEIMPIMDGTYALRFNYARLSMVLGLDYRCWLEPQAANSDEWRVDVPAFEAFFDQAMELQ
jgi:hypothetical protein